MAFSSLDICVAFAFVLILVQSFEDASGTYANERPDEMTYPGSLYRNRQDVEKQKETNAIWCFQCNSQFDQGCENIAPNDTSSTYYRQCEDDDQSLKIRNGREFFCRKIVQTIFDRDGIRRVVRKCGFVPHPTLACYSYDSEGHDDVVCQCFSDACNAAPQMKSLWVTSIAVAVNTVIFSLLTAY